MSFNVTDFGTNRKPIIIKRQNVPCSFDVSDVVKSLNAETAVSNAVRQLRVGHWVQVSRSDFIHKTRYNSDTKSRSK